MKHDGEKSKLRWWKVEKTQQQWLNLKFQFFTIGDFANCIILGISYYLEKTQNVNTLFLNFHIKSGRHNCWPIETKNNINYVNALQLNSDLIMYTNACFQCYLYNVFFTKFRLFKYCYWLVWNIIVSERNRYF